MANKIIIIAILIMSASVSCATESNVLMVEAEDSSMVSLSGAWQIVNDNGPKIIQSSNSGDMLSYRFFGTEVSINAKKDANGGTAQIKIDGVYKGTLEFYSEQEKNARINLAEGLENKYHTLEVIVSSESGYVYIDSIVTGSPTEIPSLQPNFPEEYYIQASYNRPWIFQDSKGIYWISMEIQSMRRYGDIFITSSKDGINWEKPRQITTSINHDYDTALVQDKIGEYWMVFTRIELVNGKAENIPYITHSKDGITWAEPHRMQIPQNNAYYPFLFYDKYNRFIYAYASGAVEEDEYHDNIFIMTSQDGITWTPPLQITNNSMDSSYYPTIVQDNQGEYWLYFVSPKYQNKSIYLNHNDIFVMHSKDLIKWSAPQVVTDRNQTVAYNYLHPTYSNGTFYLAIMANPKGYEDAYILESKDGIHFTSPKEMVQRAPEDTRIIDYKSMNVDQNGTLWIAYSKVESNSVRHIYLIKSKDGRNWSEPLKVSPDAYFNSSYQTETNPKSQKKTSGLPFIITGICIVIAFILKRKNIKRL